MKLYAWQPKGHGQVSFFVMSENEDQAKKAVNNEIKRLLAASNQDDFPDCLNYTDYYFYGWGTDYYELTVCGEDQIVLNNND